MGKFSTSKPRPRPILVKLLRSADVTLILTNKRKLSVPNVFIKPFMSPAERKCEGILLKERRSLISNGTNPQKIKLRQHKLIVDGSLYGEVSGNSFTLSPDFPDHTLSHDINSSADPLPISPPSASSFPYFN